MNYEFFEPNGQYSSAESRSILTYELYRGLERVSDGKPTFFRIHDLVSSSNQPTKEKVWASSAGYFRPSEAGLEFLVAKPLAPNELAMFLHVNELIHFVQQRVGISQMEVSYLPYQQIAELLPPISRESVVDLPLTFYPDTKNYVVLGRNDRKNPRVTLNELATAHRTWLQGIYTEEPMHFPHIDVIVYEKRSQPDATVHFRKLSTSTEAVNQTISYEDARKAYQVYPLADLETFIQ